MLNYLGSFLKCSGCDKQFKFDIAYCHGYYSVEPDGSMALHCLCKALEAGDGIAAANLAMLYRFGSAGIDKDEENSWSYARTTRKMGIFLC